MIKVLICGDYCPQDRVTQIINRGEGKYVFDDVRHHVSSVDISIVNLECAVTEDLSSAIIKDGPCLACNEKSVELLREVGFGVATLANNHVLDFADNALLDTISTCEKHGIITVGAGKDAVDAAKNQYINHEEKKVALINCCEHEFSIATDTSAGTNALNPIQQYYAIQEAKTKADYVIIIVHGGTEHYQLPSPRMQETYRFFIDAGADVVVNHHQHCYSGYEIYKEKPIFYGLGNFCFDSKLQRDSSWNEGYMLQLELGDAIGFELIPYVQCNKVAKVELMTGEEKSIFFQRIDSLNKQIGNRDELIAAYHARCKSSVDEIQLICSPYTSRIAIGLARRHMIPLFLNKVRSVRLLSSIQCESHYEKMIFMLRCQVNNSEK